jgi:hypothetical protein
MDQIWIVYCILAFSLFFLYIPPSDLLLDNKEVSAWPILSFGRLYGVAERELLITICKETCRRQNRTIASRTLDDVNVNFCRYVQMPVKWKEQRNHQIF